MNRTILGCVVSVAMALTGPAGGTGGVSLAQAHDPLVMVVNKANATGPIGKPEAKKLLLGTTNVWPDGKKVVVVLSPPGSADRAAAMQAICGMTPVEFTRYQMQAMFTGREPVKSHEEASGAAIKAFVKANPGAIGIIHESDLDKEVKSVLTLP